MARRWRLRPIRKRQLAFFRGLFLIILGCISIFYFIQSPFWSLQTIKVEGNKFVASEEIVQLSGLPLELNIFKVDLKQGERNISLHPLVRNAKLSRKLPRAVLVKIEERTPLALLPFAGGFYQIDEQQVVLRNVATVSGAELPLITGLELENTNLGDVVFSKQLGVALQLVQEFSSELLDTVAEFCLSDPDTIYLHMASGVQVNFGGGDRIEVKAKLLENILQAAEIETQALEYVDISFAGSPVIKYID